VEIIAGKSLIGGGSAPDSTLATFLLAVTASSLSADELAARLRRNTPAIVARVEDGRLLLDLRTVFEYEELVVAKALLEIGH
jgi:L-seryl-tRNA(Ser) seleniumtransferase